MIFDTDVLIWCFRGDAKAARKIDATTLKQISVVTLMELLQGARNQNEQRQIRNFLSQAAFVVLPMTDEIGHRASILIEAHALAGDRQLADALIAATVLHRQRQTLPDHQGARPQRIPAFAREIVPSRHSRRGGLSDEASTR